MVCLISPGHLLLLIFIIFHCATSTPVLERTNEEDLRGMRAVSRTALDELGYPFNTDYVDDLLDEKQSMPRESGLQTRQLGDIEFSNKYSEHLRSKAKITIICSLLWRMQNVKKSDAERASELWRQYSCPTVYKWTSDL